MSVYNLERIRMPAVPPIFKDDTGNRHYVPAPCQVACPVGTDAPSYIAYIWEKKYPQAFEAITASNPFSSICGRVCDAPCEPACRRQGSDGALQIRNLKRFVMEQLGTEHVAKPVPVSRSETVAIVGAGPAGLSAANDLCTAGFAVDVYEMTDRPGGMMAWGIPEFRLPAGIIEQDIKRLQQKCPGLTLHLNTALGRDLTLQELKARHSAVLLTIGAWWGKPMGIPGEDHGQVVDGVSFLRRINSGERPRLPETVVVVGGGDVAMDACRAAKRLPSCQSVKVVYRRGPEDIPARKIELHQAAQEGIEFIYNTLPIGVRTAGNGLALQCVRTEAGARGADGRRSPMTVAGSEHDIACGMAIAAVGQKGECAELDTLGLMDSGRVRADFASMRTGDPAVFAAGDGAFGGSTIVMAMHHGQRAAYYIRAFLDGIDQPAPYRTPYRSRSVPVAQDPLWEQLPVQEPDFHGLGKKPDAFPEIEDTYDEAAALREAARCYRCDAETGSADYAVRHREDLFSMGRTEPQDLAKHQAMLQRRLQRRDNPYPQERWPSLDDLVFLPANLSRLVIDPYREACRIDMSLGGGVKLELPFLIGGLDQAPAEVRAAAHTAITAAGVACLSTVAPGEASCWLQLLTADAIVDSSAAGIVAPWETVCSEGLPVITPGQLRGISISEPQVIDAAVDLALAEELDLLVLDGTGGLSSIAAELNNRPRFELLKKTVNAFRQRRKEEAVTLVYAGGVRSGTDAARLIALGASAVVYGVAAALALGGTLSAQGISFPLDHTADERAAALGALLKANAGEASMMARCTGKTQLHNLEPEDLRAVTIATSTLTGIPLVGHRPARGGNGLAA